MLSFLEDFDLVYFPHFFKVRSCKKPNSLNFILFFRSFEFVLFKFYPEFPEVIVILHFGGNYIILKKGNYLLGV